LSRILFVDDAPDEWQLALASVGDHTLTEQITLVRDKDEALDFLHERGTFRHRLPGLPAVVVLGPNTRRPVAMSLVDHIRNDAALRRVPVVMFDADPDEPTVFRSHYSRVNSLIRVHRDERIRAEQYAALVLFWGRVNEPPPGSLPQPKRQYHGP
jgi:CheY-like chemotaxis protein